MRILFFIFCFLPLGMAAQPKIGVIKVRKPQQHNFFLDINEIPQYSAGNPEKDIQRLMNYPKNVDAEGIVLVNCIIGKDGKINHAEIKKGIQPDIDKEALRIVYALKDFKPYTKDGNTIAVRFTLPIKFSKPKN